jgi:hypothetical protein
MNKMKKQKTTQLSKTYFILLLTLGMVIIFESGLIINTLGVREKLTRAPVVKKMIPQPQFKKGTMKVTLEKNQKVTPNKDVKAIIEFDSPDEAVAGVDAVLTLDPKAISVVNISGNKEIFDQIIINTQKQKEGRIKITAYSPTKTLVGEQVLGSLTLRLLEKQPAILGIEFLGPDVVTDSNLVSQKTQKDILGRVQGLKLNPQ